MFQLCHFPFFQPTRCFFPSKNKHNVLTCQKVPEAAFTSDQLTLIRFALDQKAMMQLGHLAQGFFQRMPDFSGFIVVSNGSRGCNG